MIPNEIAMMVHYYFKTNDYEDVEVGYLNSVNDLVMKGLLRPTGGVPKYTITARGMAYVEALKAVPLPVQKWVMPE